MQEDTESGGQQPAQVLEPIVQDEIPFRDHTITAVRLADGRIAVVVRWVCEVLNLDTQGQVQRIQRTAAISQELLRVKVQPRPGAEKPRRGGGAQVMPVLTLRGFSPWILGINPGEVQDDPDQPGKAERIREMILAYQVEAVDVLYQHFMQKGRAILPVPGAAETRAVIVPAAEPMKPEPEPAPGASDEELASYFEDLALWAYWKAKHHAQVWRGQVVAKIEDQAARLEEQESRLEAKEAVLNLIPDILNRLGPETINDQQQRKVQDLVHQLHEATGKHQATIYNDLKTAFDCPRYQELKADEWPQVLTWFKVQIERAQQGKK